MGSAIQNVLERVLALAGLLVLSPVAAVAAFFIWREDGFPILFRQQRVGLGGRLFQLLKLRSMRKSDEGTLVTAGGDPRITPVGRIIRKYKLDELPQLWNVVRGDMSLVGPRPEVPRYVDMTNPAWRTVLSVRPGITDLATLVCRDEEAMLAAAEEPEKYYREILLPRKLAVSQTAIEKRSLYRDVLLLVITVLCSFLPSKFDAVRLSETLFGVSFSDSADRQRKAA
jgi:lipopolysaccharide/colanic/teichoic acid biosynthesis glycosyltransferase